MALKHFKTERGLWLKISLLLFAVPWFVPMVGGKGTGNMPPVAVLIGLIWEVLFDPTRVNEDGFVFIGLFTVFFALPAIAVGWVSQALVVIVRDARRDR
jgi:hypothetical protein